MPDQELLDQDAAASANALDQARVGGTLRMASRKVLELEIGQRLDTQGPELCQRLIGPELVVGVAPLFRRSLLALRFGPETPAAKCRQYCILSAARMAVDQHAAANVPK